MLHVACGNRREAVCPACSAVYKRDARQLVRAGLAGGKGIPETITAHPCVFATLTAPSFGPVHARRMRGKTVLPCRPRRDAHARRCPHGRDISCPTRHVEEDPRLGQPMCGDCYDYQAAVLFNACAGDLWRRFTTYLPRHLARLAGVTGRELRAAAPHPVRQGGRVPGTRRRPLPRRDPPGRPRRGLPAPARPVHRQPAVRRHRPGRRRRPRPRRPRREPAALLRFGTQTDTRPIRRDTIAATGQPLDGQAVANYIAKYATKTLTAPGVPAQRLRHLVDIEHLRCSAHYKQMITTAWQLGGRRQTGDPRFRQWAHMLGYGGHFLTKSRRYSVTFGQLRKARTDHRRQQRHPDGERDPWGRPLDDAEVLVLRTWTYAGTGYTSATPGAELAARLRRPRPRASRPGRMTNSAGNRPRKIKEDLPVSKILLTVPEAASTLAISRSKLYELLAAGSIRSVRIDGSRRIPVEALEAYVARLLDGEVAANAAAS